jgi:hypothetical protein
MSPSCWPQRSERWTNKDRDPAAVPNAGSYPPRPKTRAGLRLAAFTTASRGLAGIRRRPAGSFSRSPRGPGNAVVVTRIELFAAAIRSCCHRQARLANLPIRRYATRRTARRIGGPGPSRHPAPPPRSRGAPPRRTGTPDQSGACGTAPGAGRPGQAADRCAAGWLPADWPARPNSTTTPVGIGVWRTVYIGPARSPSAKIAPAPRYSKRSRSAA